MDNAERAAILLLGMGEEKAAMVLKHMDPKQVERIVIAMNHLSNVSQDDVKSVLGEFVQATKGQSNFSVKKDYIKNALKSALGDDRAQSLLERTKIDDGAAKGLDLLKWQDAQQVFELIKHEHPQIIAVILTYLDSEQSAQILACLTKEMHADLLHRIAHLSTLSPLALDELNQFMTNQASSLKSFKTLSAGGAKTAADIVNYLDSDLEHNILQGMASLDESLTNKIQDLMFPFEKLASLDDRSLQMLLRDIQSETLVIALKGADETVRAKIFKNMSARAAEMVKDDLEAKGPLPLSQVMKAQKEIVAIAHRLAKEGKVLLGNKGETMV